MMSTADMDVKLYFRRKHTPPLSVLLLSAPVDKSRYYSTHLRSHQQKTRHPPQMVGLHVNNLDIHDTSPGWQRYSNKSVQVPSAPDVAYRNTYLEEPKREKSGSYRSRSPSPSLKLNNSFSFAPAERHHSNQYRTIYDYIRDSIRQIEQQRNLKQQNISSRVKRPQNEDSTLRRVLGDRKPSTRSSLSRSSSTTRTTTQTISPLINNDLKSPQSFVNYINFSRVLQPTTSDQFYEQ